MACFTLTTEQRIFLAACISVGLEGADTDEGMEDAIGAVLMELEASDKPIEITMMPIDPNDTVCHVPENGLLDQFGPSALRTVLDKGDAEWLANTAARD